jgi:hypothetical protein
MYKDPLVLTALGLGVGLLLRTSWRRLWWLVQGHRHPATAGPARFAVWHQLGPARRLYHTSNDPRTAKAHYNANNAPRGTIVEFYDGGKFRGRRVQT